MLKHQLLEVLKTFSDHEKKRFGKFLNSAYFNKSPKINKLFFILKRYHPYYDNRGITKQAIYKKLDYGLAYNDSTIRNLIYDLQELAEKYLRQQNLGFKWVETSVYTREEFLRRDLNKLFEINIENAEIKLAKHKTFDPAYFYNKYKVSSDNFLYHDLYHKVKKENYTKKLAPNLAEGIEYLVNDFVIELAKQYSGITYYNKMLNVPQKNKFLTELVKVADPEKIFAMIENNPIPGSFLTGLYIELYRTFQHLDNEKYYKDYKKSLINNSDKVGKDDIYFLSLKLIDYCDLKIQTGKKVYEKELFDVYELILKKKWYETETSPYIPLELFTRIFWHAYNMKKHQWAETFINTYKNKLLTKYKIDVPAYYFGLLYFERGKFTQAAGFLNKIKYDDFIYKLDAYNLQLKTYFEIGKFEQAPIIIEEYKTWIAPFQPVPDDVKEKHNKFISYINKMVRYKLGKKALDRYTMKKSIEKNQYVISKDWLLKTLDTIDKK
jgi:hypothetical protein